MGVLYEQVVKQKRKLLIQELTELNVTETVKQVPINKAEYEDLQETLVNEVLKKARIIDISAEANKYF